jgi:spore coat polysaccharide biosynthesis protein SpsF
MGMRKLGIVIQARLNSTRLPKKILLPVNNEPLILFLLKRIIASIDLPLIVATSTSSGDDELCQLLQDNGILYYRGSEQDVLERFIGAAEAADFTDIIRICSDNPFLDLTYLDKLIKSWRDDSTSDYISYAIHGSPVILTHLGVFAEIIKLDALKKVKQLFPDNTLYKEHVTNGVYKNADHFRVRFIEIAAELENTTDVRLTVDTAEDYERIRFISTACKDLSFPSILQFLEQHPEIKESMAITIKQNSK